MSNDKSAALKHIEENYKLIPMSDITDEARILAVRWVEGYEPEGIINLEQKHKLASDIMNYAEFHAKGFAEWLQANRWYNFENGKWHYTFEHGTYISKAALEKNYIKTTSQLHELYLKSLKP